MSISRRRPFFDMIMCRCGVAAHPIYEGCCENCWVDRQILLARSKGRIVDKAFRSLKMSVASKNSRVNQSFGLSMKRWE